MARKLFSIRNGSWVGEFPSDPEQGWETCRRGIRRRLCRVVDLAGLSEAERARLLTDLYHAKQLEIRREQQQVLVRTQNKKRQLRNISMSQAFEMWLEEVAITNSVDTLKRYGRTRDLYLAGVQDHRLRDFDRSANIAFLKYLSTEVQYRGRALSETTQAIHIRQLGVFLHWAHDHELVDRTWRLKKPTPPKKDMDTFSIDELHVLGDYIESQLAAAIAKENNRQIMHLSNMRRAFMLATQSLLRLGALWALRLENIDLPKRMIRIRDNEELGWVNKKKKHPNKPINDKLAAFLKQDLAGRDPREQYFLDNGRGFPWYADRADISKFAARMCKEAGLPKLKPFHWGMRATMITALLQHGADPLQVQQLADHDDLATTMLYKDSRRISQKGAADALGDLL